MRGIPLHFAKRTDDRAALIADATGTPTCPSLTAMGRADRCGIFTTDPQLCPVDDRGRVTCRERNHLMTVQL